jgi:glycosyltransferase involved in cell wall biosynthesis
MAGVGRARARRGRVGVDRSRLRVVGPAVSRLASGASEAARVSSGHSGSPVRPLRIVFCWAEVTGYMAACWQELATRPGIDLHILHTEQLTAQEPPFDLGPLLSGLSHQPFAKDLPNVDRWLLEQVASRQPDVVVICGWIFWPYTRLLSATVLEPATKVLGMDSPWRGTPAQRLARFRLRRIVRHTDLVITAGERSATYAQRMGIPERSIRSGYYGFDYDRFSPVAHRRPSAAGLWPRRFLFAGRYVPQKDLGTLMSAYAEYRRGVADPWDLTCCGTGEAAGLLRDQPGVTDAGFTQPSAQPAVFARHGAFVLASKFEPWGVVLAEAAASGMPLVCTTACGAAADLVRPYHNGLLITAGDVAGLARALRWIHDHEAELPAMGRRGQALAEAFSAQAWATRWHQYLLDTVEHVSLTRASR